MEKVKLIFKGVGLKDKNQVYVKIYDNNCNLIYEGNTFDGVLITFLESNKAYNMLAKFHQETIVATFYVGSCNNKYIFSFNRINNIRNITFLLTDFYYTNLPIERGDIILWQR